MKKSFSYTVSHFWNFLQFLLVIARKFLLNFQVRDCVLKFLPKNVPKSTFLAKIESITVSPLGETMYDSNFRTFNYNLFQPKGLVYRPVAGFWNFGSLSRLSAQYGPLYQHVASLEANSALEDRYVSFLDQRSRLSSSNWARIRTCKRLWRF